MADYESNTIKPVKGLDTIAGVAPTRQREERKRRQQLNCDQDEATKGQVPLPEEQPQNEGKQDNGRIDYCA